MYRTAFSLGLCSWQSSLALLRTASSTDRHRPLDTGEVSGAGGTGVVARLDWIPDSRPTAPSLLHDTRSPSTTTAPAHSYTRVDEKLLSHSRSPAIQASSKGTLSHHGGFPQSTLTDLQHHTHLDVNYGTVPPCDVPVPYRTAHRSSGTDSSTEERRGKVLLSSV